MPKVSVICDNCGTTFERYPSTVKKHNFCNKQCYNEYHSKDTKYYICEICGKKFKGMKHNANRFCSRACYDKFHNIKNKERECPVCHKKFLADRQTRIYCSMECYNKDRHAPKGENHPNWKGGISKLNDKKDSWDYKNWRQKVYERDNWTCQQCGIKGNKINAHHIKSWKYYPKLRYSVDNGVTLCEECHIKIHQHYGYDTIEPMNILK